jgi:hypothetical protein
LGFEAVDTGDIIASFSRHLMTGFHEWGETGFAPIARRWLDRLPQKGNEHIQLAENGDLLISRDAKLELSERRDLTEALATPSWLDPATGTPWL